MGIVDKFSRCIYCGTSGAWSPPQCTSYSRRTACCWVSWSPCRCSPRTGWGERDMGQKSENGTGGCPGRRSRGYPASDLGVLSQISGDTPKPAQSRQNRTWMWIRLAMVCNHDYIDTMITFVIHLTCSCKPYKLNWHLISSNIEAMQIYPFQIAH